MASNPSFDPNVSRTTVPKNRAIGENYEPGSIFKIIAFAAALEEGLITPDQVVDLLGGEFQIPNERPIRDPFPLSETTFSEAFRLSSNIASLKIAGKLGNRLFYSYIERFGMGAQTGIGLFEEERGILHHFNNWRARDAMSISFGNAISVTALQMAIATSAIANGGFILRPQIYRRITDERGRIITGNNGQRRETRRTVVRQVISDETAETMRLLMSDVVNERGTGRAAFIEGLNIGGKTGTSRIVRGGRYLENNYWASFIGITPIDQPALVAVVSVYDPLRGRFGGPVAGAAVAQIMKNIVASPKVTIGKDIRLYRDTTEAATQHWSDQQREIRIFPNLTGLDLRTARRISSESRIDFEIMGTGNVVLSQDPTAGTEVRNLARVVLFTDSIDTQITMPNFVGVNIRDAIEMLRQRGITPTFVEEGIGRVRRQYPTVGTFWQEGMPCSLFVERGISDLW
jgi:membrane peptidoglycan carboxypeptidase